MTDAPAQKRQENALRIRKATLEHLPHAIELDARITGKSKPDYWQDIFDRYGSRHVDERFFLIAERSELPSGPEILGLIVGEVRGWEFGSEPCGWVFAVSVDPDFRQQGIGEALFQALCEEFRKIGTTTVRTMVRRQDPLHMSFFRSEGMMAGPYIQMELSLAEE